MDRDMHDAVASATIKRRTHYVCVHIFAVRY